MKKTLGIFFSILIIFSPFLFKIPSALSQNPNYFIQSHWASVTPVIDGQMSISEWADATCVYFKGTGTYPNGTDVYFYIKNDANFLYLCFDVPKDITQDNGDQVWVEIYKGIPNILSILFNYYYGAGYGYDDYNRYYGAYGPLPPPSTPPEIARGFYSSTNNNSPHRIYEMKLPLQNSGIWCIGNPGDSIGLNFYLGDASVPFPAGGTDWIPAGWPTKPSDYGTVRLSSQLPLDKTATIIDTFYSTQNFLAIQNWDSIRSKIISNLEKYGYSVSWTKDSMVTINWLKTNLNHGIIFWRGHGNVGPVWGSSCVSLVTGEKYVDGSENWPQYADDYNNGRITTVTIPWYLGGGNYWAITPKFIDYYYHSIHFPYSLVYVEACQSLGDNSMAQSFASLGAGSYMGYPNPISNYGIAGLGADYVSEASFEDFCNKGYDVKQVADDLAWCSSVAGSTLSFSGNSNLKLVGTTPSASKSATISVHCPVSLYVKDPQGRCIGFDPATDSVVEQIPGAFYYYSQNSGQVIWIPEAVEGNYDIKLLGNATGSFSITTAFFDISQSHAQLYDGTIIAGQVLTSTMILTPTSLSSTAPSHLPASDISNKLSMARYTRLELQWLTFTIKNMNIKEGVKQGLVDKLVAADQKLYAAINYLGSDNINLANNMLGSSENILNALMNQIHAQTGKGITVCDAANLSSTTSSIIIDIESTKQAL